MSNVHRLRHTAGLLSGLMAVVWLTSGCAGTVMNMREVDRMEPRAEGMSRIIFMRPKTLGFAIQSSVFEIEEKSEAKLVGIVAAKKKLAHDVEPGEHLFMVVGEAADFMSADLEANKTYYAEVVPRMGVWKARFGLRAISTEQIGTGRPDEWANSCDWVVVTPESQAWAEKNHADIQRKLERYLNVWYRKEERDRPRLQPSYGR